MSVHDGGEDLVDVCARADEEAEHEAEAREVEEGRLGRRGSVICSVSGKMRRGSTILVGVGGCRWRGLVKESGGRRDRSFNEGG